MFKRKDKEPDPLLVAAQKEVRVHAHPLRASRFSALQLYRAVSALLPSLPSGRITCIVAHTPPSLLRCVCVPHTGKTPLRMSRSCNKSTTSSGDWTTRRRSWSCCRMGSP